MGFRVLKEDYLLAESIIECDGCKAMLFGMSKHNSPSLSFADIRIYVDAIREGYNILPSTQYVSLEIVNEDSGELKSKNFRPEILELLFKYHLCPKWLAEAVMKTD